MTGVGKHVHVLCRRAVSRRRRGAQDAAVLSVWSGRQHRDTSRVYRSG